MSKSALSVLSNRAFVILGFQFKSLIHIVYFYICINKIIQLYSFTCGCPVFPTLLMKEIACFLLEILTSFIIGQLIICISIYFCILYSVSLTYVSVIVPVPYSFDYHRFELQFEIRENKYLQFGSFSFFSFFFPFPPPKIILSIWGLFWFHTNVTYSISVKDVLGILQGLHKICGLHGTVWQFNHINSSSP